MNDGKRIILASASPRRRELLQHLVESFSIIPADIDEQLDSGCSSSEAVKRLALRKARAIAEQCRDNATIIGADTIVVIEGKILGKPCNAEKAFEMLMLLQGRTHEVITGLAVIDCRTESEWVEAAITRVSFDFMSRQQILDYIESGDPFDKAGAYGIQGGAAKYIAGIEGCYYNVVGLPLNLCRKMLETASK